MNQSQNMIADLNRKQVKLFVHVPAMAKQRETESDELILPAVHYKGDRPK